MASEALEAALRALRQRDLSVRELDERLSRSGVADAPRAEVLEALQRAGLLDERRFAEGRAWSLARRGAGDALIRHELESAGVEQALVDEAIEALEPELERARAIVARRGTGARTARYLSAKGFPEEIVAAVAIGSWDALG